MAKYIFNNSGSSKTYVGQLINDQEYYLIDAAEEVAFSNDSTLLGDLDGSTILISKTDGTSGHITNLNESINYLKDKPALVDADAAPIVRSRAFANSDGFRARFKGIQGTATKTTTTNIDYKITEDRYINGVRLILSDHVDDDYVDFQVVDVDNLLGYGAGTVLDTFGDNWYVDAGVCTQPDVLVPYPAKITAGFYLRVAYHSVGTIDDVDVRANLFLHYKAP